MNENVGSCLVTHSVYNKMLQVKVYFFIWLVIINRNQFCQSDHGSKINLEKVSSFEWTVISYFYPHNNLTTTPFHFPHDSDVVVDMTYVASFKTRNYARLIIKFHCDTVTKIFTETVVIMNQDIEMNFMNYECKPSKVVSWPVGIIKLNVEHNLLFLYSRHPLLEVEALVVLKRSFLIIEKLEVLQHVVHEFGHDVITNNALQYFDITTLNEHLCMGFFDKSNCDVDKIRNAAHENYNLIGIWIVVLMAIVVWVVCIFVSFCLKSRK